MVGLIERELGGVDEHAPEKAIVEEIVQRLADGSGVHQTFKVAIVKTEMVNAMAQLTDGRIFMSFPKAREWRAPIRRLRFKLLRCPLHLYSKAQVREILSEGGITHYECIDLGRDYIIVASV